MTTHPPSHTPLINHIPPNPQHKRRLSDNLPPFLANYVPTFDSQHQRRAVMQTGNTLDWCYAYLKARYHSLSYHLQNRTLKDFFDIRLFLIALWLVVLSWGETWTFHSHIRRCDWHYWERWPLGANPHHVALIADPQLVDPHTYPGRPWPLSWASVFYTDLYMRKSFRQITGQLEPESVFFLGDLFDGGREWSPPGAEADAEKEWRHYGQQQWMKEYVRFRKIFVDTWIVGARRRERKKILMSLPGNHDLGLGNGIRIPVRNRFNAYFGPGNRIDVIGNHTFVSVDTVSLSAKGQPDSSGQSAHAAKAIWEPTEQFLSEAKAIKVRAVDRQCRRWRGEAENELAEHKAIYLSDPAAHTNHLESAPNHDVPSILLSHVPLYRPDGTQCGPFREHWPPSNPSAPDEKDNRNAIPIQYGKQYQNVLTAAISHEIVDLVGDITHVFSGDDHDYCEVVHREYTARGGGVREITVKAFSWAMGIQRPGFLLLSLWNPINDQGKAVSPQKSTVQSHLCLLPDQLGIFVRYVWLLVFTLLALVGSATRRSLRRQPGDRGDGGVLNGSSLLPLARTTTETKAEMAAAHSSTSDQLGMNGLSARSRPRNSCQGYGYTPPHTPHPASLSANEYEDVNTGKAWQDFDLKASSTTRSGRGVSAVMRETRRALTIVAVPVGFWYLWLLWSI